MAEGIQKVDQSQLITYHPTASQTASTYFNDSWLSVDMLQSDHDRRVADYDLVAEALSHSPARPVISGESRYENIPDRLDKQAQYGWLDDSDVRVTAYWSMLSGAAGYTYGSNDVWQMHSAQWPPILMAHTDWKDALHLPGARQMTFMKNLLTALPWQELRNDQSLILNENPRDSTHQVSAISQKDDLILAYTPLGKELKIDLSKIRSKRADAYWFDPRSGKLVKIGTYLTSGNRTYKPDSTGRGSDYLLVIMDTKAGYKLAGD